MPKFFADEKQINLDTNTITLDSESSKHIAKVLRYKIGDTIDICNGNMTDYECVITDISDIVTLSIISQKESSFEFPFTINLFQGIAKGDKMDTIIQKATELGITNIVPIETTFTVVKLIGDDKIEKKLERWNKIAKEAAKQSERSITPLIKEPLKFKDAIKNCVNNNEIVLICYGREKDYTLKTFFNDISIATISSDNPATLSFFIGPEGGFSEDEINFAADLGVKSVSLGNRILRTETASACFLSMLQYALFK